MQFLAVSYTHLFVIYGLNSKLDRDAALPFRLRFVLRTLLPFDVRIPFVAGVTEVVVLQMCIRDRSNTYF